MSHAVRHMLHAELNIRQEMVHCPISSLTEASTGVNGEGGRFNVDKFEIMRNHFRPFQNINQLFGSHGYIDSSSVYYGMLRFSCSALLLVTYGACLTPAR